jgi:hypothetical protein
MKGQYQELDLIPQNTSEAQFQTLEPEGMSIGSPDKTGRANEKPRSRTINVKASDQRDSVSKLDMNVLMDHRPESARAGAETKHTFEKGDDEE